MTTADLIVAELETLCDTEQLRQFANDGNYSLDYWQSLVAARIGQIYSLDAWDRAMDLVHDLYKLNSDDVIGIIYPDGCGCPEGEICISCAQGWEQANEGGYDADSGQGTAAICANQGSFECGLCEKKIQGID